MTYFHIVIQSFDKADLYLDYRRLCKCLNGISIFIVKEKSSKGLHHTHSLVFVPDPKGGDFYDNYLSSSSRWKKTHTHLEVLSTEKYVKNVITYMCKDLNDKSVEPIDYRNNFDVNYGDKISLYILSALKQATKGSAQASTGERKYNNIMQDNNKQPNMRNLREKRKAQQMIFANLSPEMYEHIRRCSGCGECNDVGL